MNILWWWVKMIGSSTLTHTSPPRNIIQRFKIFYCGAGLPALDHPDASTSYQRCVAGYALGMEKRVTVAKEEQYGWWEEGWMNEGDLLSILSHKSHLTTQIASPILVTVTRTSHVLLPESNISFMIITFIITSIPMFVTVTITFNPNRFTSLSSSWCITLSASAL